MILRGHVLDRLPRIPAGAVRTIDTYREPPLEYRIVCSGRCYEATIYEPCGTRAVWRSSAAMESREQAHRAVVTEANRQRRQLREAPLEIPR